MEYVGRSNKKYVVFEAKGALTSPGEETLQLHQNVFHDQTFMVKKKKSESHVTSSMKIQGE